jgi:hypothetical protein
MCSLEKVYLKKKLENVYDYEGLWIFPFSWWASLKHALFISCTGIFLGPRFNR